MEPWQKWAAHRPKAGDPVHYVDADAKPPTDWRGNIVRVEGACAWVDYGNAGEEGTGLERFTWCFAEKLNSLHEWPAKVQA
jgi:hypothetical protein